MSPGSHGGAQGAVEQSENMNEDLSSPAPQPILPRCSQEAACVLLRCSHPQSYIYCTVKPGCYGEPGTARNRTWLVGMQGRNHPVWTGRLQRWGTWHRRELLHLAQRAEQLQLWQLCRWKAHNPSEQLCANTFIWFSSLNSSPFFFFFSSRGITSWALPPCVPSSLLPVSSLVPLAGGPVSPVALDLLGRSDLYWFIAKIISTFLRSLQIDRVIGGLILPSQKIFAHLANTAVSGIALALWGAKQCLAACLEQGPTTSSEPQDLYFRETLPNCR